MRPLLFLMLLLNWAAAFGQEKSLVLAGKLPSPTMDIGPYTTFYVDQSGDTLPLETIRRQRFRPFTKKPDERTNFTKRSILITYLKFTLRNTHPTDTLRVMHQTGTHGLITLYSENQVIGRTGIGLPPQRRPDRFSLLLSVPPGTERTYLVRVMDYYWSPTPVWSKLATISASIATEFGDYAIGKWALLAIMSLLTGCLLFMSLYALYSFLLTRDTAFLYYASYTLICVLFIAHSIDHRFGFAMLFPIRISDVIAPFHIALFGFFYTLFLAKVLALKTEYPLMWRILKGLLALMVLQELHCIAEYAYGKPFFLDAATRVYSMVPAGLATLLLAIALLRSQSPIRYYLLAGMICLVGIGIVPGSLDLYFINLSPLLDTFVNYPYFWLALGLATEAFCFLLALAYRGRLIELENSRIQKQYSHDLEAQLLERTQEIEQKSRMMEQQHIRQLETEFEQKLADTEMTALRAQMNPHFIFNCLNSIKLYTLDNEADKASDYLTKFSRLIRLVLENSRSKLVSLQNELEALQLYIELEAMRFKQKLRFSIQVSPGIDQRYLRIPPLLLQPYVENAIWHGLMHKPEGGTVTVVVSQPQENLLHIEIADDGVGRERAAELKSKSAGKHKSFGMQVTADRIRMINQLYNIQTHVRIDDLVDAEGQPAGTEVILHIPI